MKKIEAFEFRMGWGSEKETTKKVNARLAELAQEGKIDVEIIVTSTGKGVVYTLIWKE